MKVIDHLKDGTRPLVSVELVPPRRGSSMEDFRKVLDAIRPFDIVPFIDVTSHAADAEMKELPDGSVRRCVKRKSPGTFGLCAVIKYKYGIDPVPHLLCHGFTREETEDALIELNYLGIENVLAVQGDGVPKQLTRSDRSVNTYALDLVDQISDMNRGVYQGGIENAAATDFCVGVGCYPEKHFGSPNIPFDIQVLKDKQDHGAEYAVTQMVFDNRKYFEFVRHARSAGVTIPIIPGIKILTSKRQLFSIPRAFHVDIPPGLSERMLAAASRKEEREIGVAWALGQIMELLRDAKPEDRIPCVHVYTMLRAGALVEVLKRVKSFF